MSPQSHAPRAGAAVDADDDCVAPHEHPAAFAALPQKVAGTPAAVECRHPSDDVVDTSNVSLSTSSPPASARENGLNSEETVGQPVAERRRFRPAPSREVEDSVPRGTQERRHWKLRGCTGWFRQNTHPNGDDTATPVRGGATQGWAPALLPAVFCALAILRLVQLFAASADDGSIAKSHWEAVHKKEEEQRVLTEVLRHKANHRHKSSDQSGGTRTHSAPDKHLHALVGADLHADLREQLLLERTRLHHLEHEEQYERTRAESLESKLAEERTRAKALEAREARERSRLQDLQEQLAVERQKRQERMSSLQKEVEKAAKAQRSGEQKLKSMQVRMAAERQISKKLKAEVANLTQETEELAAWNQQEAQQLEDERAEAAQNLRDFENQRAETAEQLRKVKKERAEVAEQLKRKTMEAQRAERQANTTARKLKAEVARSKREERQFDKERAAAAEQMNSMHEKTKESEAERRKAERRLLQAQEDAEQEDNAPGRVGELQEQLREQQEATKRAATEAQAALQASEKRRRQLHEQLRLVTQQRAAAVAQVAAQAEQARAAEAKIREFGKQSQAQARKMEANRHEMVKESHAQTQLIQAKNRELEKKTRELETKARELEKSSHAQARTMEVARDLEKKNQALQKKYTRVASGYAKKVPEANRIKRAMASLRARLKRTTAALEARVEQERNARQAELAAERSKRAEAELAEQRARQAEAELEQQRMQLSTLNKELAEERRKHSDDVKELSEVQERLAWQQARTESLHVPAYSPSEETNGVMAARGVDDEKPLSAKALHGSSTYESELAIPVDKDDRVASAHAISAKGRAKHEQAVFARNVAAKRPVGREDAIESAHDADADAEFGEPALERAEEVEKDVSASAQDLTTELILSEDDEKSNAGGDVLLKHGSKGGETVRARRVVAEDVWGKQEEASVAHDAVSELPLGNGEDETDMDDSFAFESPVS